MKSISIIIPNTDSLLIAKIISRLKQQTIDMTAAEILVAGSDAPRLIHEDELVRFIAVDSPSNAAVKRNAGMRAAQGQILLFLDDDCLPAPDWVERHLYRHEQGEQVVGGAVTFGTDNYLQLADNVSAFHDLLPHTTAGHRAYLAAANLSVSRAVMVKAGEMDPHLDRAQDLAWTVRMRALGYNLYFDPRIIIFHDPARRDFATVLPHWTKNAPYTLSVRLRYAHLLRTPRLAKYRSIYLWGAPLIAAWATARTFDNLQTLRYYWHTLPLVYLTKLAWCWGAFTNFPTQ